MEEITLDELEEKSKPPAEAPKQQDLSSIKLELESLPDTMKGRSVAEIVEQNQRLQDALRISESARQQQQELASRMQTPVIMQSAPQQQQPAITEEQFNEMFQQSPAKALALVQQQTIQFMEQNFAQRLGGLTSSITTSHAQAAAQRFPDEFEALGPEIEKIIESLPDKSILASAGGWDNLVKYARGEHIDKFFDYKSKKSKQNNSREDLQQEFSSTTPPALSSQRSPAPSVNSGKYDKTQLEIMETLGLSPEEWEKWK